MLRSVASRLVARASAVTPAVRTVTATRCMSTYSFDLPEFKTWGEVETPASTTEATAEELLEYYRQMFVIRRTEIASDVEYKARNIRGFCHLYDGQEAVAMGIEAGLTREDSIITTYRCHGFDLVRGGTVEALMAEMFGFDNGSQQGKGGSMHLYNKKTNFWGGAGIVGAQVPVGTGVALANKFKGAGKWPVPVSVSLYGDGAANQGQIWEAANIAKLWDLPALYVIENNHYGMGTSVERHSCNTEYYTSGGRVIPGIQINGMDVLAVREGMRTAKAHAANGKGPLFVEIVTYRYHGHSMSDPGITYRDREEVEDVRKNQDCLLLLKKRIVESGAATEADIKALEKEVRAHVNAEVKKAKQGNEPNVKELYTHVYDGEAPPFIRGVEIQSSIVNK